MSGIRKAEKAGSWYTAEPQKLARQLTGWVQDAGTFSGQPVIAGVVPHAGLNYSGPVAAHTFAALAQTNPDLKTILVFAAVHTMLLPRAAVWAQGAWQSPLGDVPVDEDLAQQFCRAGLTNADPRPHMGDNAIELQIPFLRHLFPEIQIVPIAVPANLDADHLGREAKKICAAACVTRGLPPMSIAALGSTDLTHYGLNYGFAPAGTGQRAHEWCLENDRKLLRLAMDMRASEIVPAAMHDHSACGAGALAAATAFASASGCRKGELLLHTTSQEIHPDPHPEMFVGYAALVFRPAAEGEVIPARPSARWYKGTA